MAAGLFDPFPAESVRPSTKTDDALENREALVHLLLKMLTELVIGLPKTVFSEMATCLRLALAAGWPGV